MATDNDLVKAFKAIKTKRPKLDLLESYVEGGQPLRYSTERLEEAFRDIRARFEINWCSVIVSTTLDRLQLTGFDVGNSKGKGGLLTWIKNIFRKKPVDKATAQAANDMLDAIFDELHIDLEADKAHKAALSMESAFVIVWKTTEGDMQVYFNDPRLIHIFYESDNPRKKRYAAKWFRRDDDRHEITLYYIDKIEHWASKSTREDIGNPNDFGLESTEPNTFGIIPVFELKTEGEIVKVTSLQDAINKTFADMMVSNEFGSWAQRWVIANADPGDLKNGPNQIWWIPSGDGVGQSASVGQFTSTPPGGFLDSMDKLASYMFTITRTPKHYLINTGANISGEALLAMEAPLTKKVERHQNKFEAGWQDIGAFMLHLMGVEVLPSAITTTWKRVESIQPLTEAQTMQTAVNTGIPLETFLRRQGWTEVEIQELRDDQKREQTARRTMAQSVLDNLRVQNEQDNTSPVTGESAVRQ